MAKLPVPMSPEVVRNLTSSGLLVIRTMDEWLSQNEVRLTPTALAEEGERGIAMRQMVLALGEIRKELRRHIPELD